MHAQSLTEGSLDPGLTACDPPPAVLAGRYAPTRPNGKRVPGWDDANITLLAADMGVSYRYLLGVLCGQRNTTLSLLQRAACCLGVTLPQLIERMERACKLKLLEIAATPDKRERRRKRNERRAIQSR